MATFQDVRNVAAAMWSADNVTLTVGEQPAQVASADPQRQRVTVINDIDSVGAVYLVPNTGQRHGGIRLVPGGGFEFQHAAAVYAYAIGGDAEVYVVAESGQAC